MLSGNRERAGAFAELCRNLGDGLGFDQAAARFRLASMPSVNLTPSMTFGN